jgi:bifunctional non-homologous end joining protein LigD
MKTKKVKFTHLDKIFWPKERYTKGDVIAYYEKIAPYILRYLKDRPESLLRTPDGIKRKGFFQKDMSREHMPPFVKASVLKAETANKKVKYALIQNRESLLHFANFGCIEFNPWQSRTAFLHKPDYVTFDLDPHGRSFDDVIAVALEIHKLLDSLGIRNYCKTSGKTGMHVIAPLGTKYNYEEVRDFAKRIVERVHERLPQMTTLEQRLNKRRGKIYLDIARNAEGQTTAAPYSLRPYPGATVSTPLEWREVKRGLRPSQFTIKTIFPRLKGKGDILKPLLRQSTDLKKALKKLEQ